VSSRGTFSASIPLPRALRAASRLRVSLSYAGDRLHQAKSVVRVVRRTRR
jgi:hypothetical protein